MVNLIKVKLDKKSLVPFTIFWVINAILLYLAGTFFPQYFTLGNWRFGPVMAAVVSGLVWTVIVWFAVPLVGKFRKKLKGDYQMAVFYFVVNFVALWVTARFAPYAGFGTVRFVWLLVLAFVANIIQFAAWKLGKFQI